MNNKKRTLIQAAAALIQNGYIKGLFSGQLYRGKLKNICVPGLNCYSCPAALGACPIGALQASLTGFQTKIPYYVLGILIFFGAIFGRLICGFICPFGFLQDLIYKIPFVKKIKTFRGEKYLRLIKYFVLVFLVIIMPLSVKLTPFFCKYICPSGTLAGILLGICDNTIFALFSTRFMQKLCVLGIILLISIITARPFCRYICPLGAFYALFNKLSLVRMKTDKTKCTNCGACRNVCPMNVDAIKSPNSTECIRCMKCTTACKTGAISFKNKKSV